MTNKKSLVIIQSRFNSSRLPGKALLPIKGIPLVVLSALRAGNTGREVLVATSTEKSDDEICFALDKHNINHIRGSLDNVLSRFNQATMHMDDEDLVFRLTADNVLPDGRMLDEMENQYINSDLDIINCTPSGSHLPYGVSAELMKVKHIRDAFANAQNDFSKEHVTPYIYENYKFDSFKPRNFRGFNNFRMTIDTLDDYLSVKTLFDSSSDITKDSVQSLICNFSRMTYRPFYEKPEKPMTLGTVQMGMCYGISNESGKVGEADAIEIIKHAITEGVEFLDTASAYGDSEKIIGKALKNGWASRVKVITKLNPFTEIESCANDAVWKFATRSSVLESCYKLNLTKIDFLMLHRASHLTNNVIMEELRNFKNEGIIGDIGVSVQSPSELEEALSCDDVMIIQMPFNILDYRWNHLIPLIVEKKKSRNLLIHARSTVLQGLLQSKDVEIWNRAKIENHEEITNWLKDSYKNNEKMSVTDLCIGYVNSQDWIDSVVVGVDNLAHLYSNLQSVSMPLMSEECLKDINKHKPYVNEDSLDPKNWRAQ